MMKPYFACAPKDIKAAANNSNDFLIFIYICLRVFYYKIQSKLRIIHEYCK